MEEKKLYIEREGPDGALYEKLQRNTLDELQRLSGEVWTDYNPSDSGVTAADIVNYALTELDYKLDFDLRDYLTDEDGNFVPERYGLFLPEAVYPTAPVTTEDYRKLLLAEFPEIENTEIKAGNIWTGRYSMTLYLSPFGENTSELRSRVFSFFHRHRNLCENLREENIRIYDNTSPENELSLFSEVELETGADPTLVLTRIYWKILRYLAGSVRIRRLDRNYRSGNVSIEEWMDGTGRDTDVQIPHQKNTQEELFAGLCGIDGVKSFKTCYFVKGNTVEDIAGRETVSSFSGGNRLFIPRNRRELKVRMYSNGTELTVNMERFHAELQSLYFARKDRQPKNREGDGNRSEFSRSLLKPGVYRDVWEHTPVSRDFPEMYRSEMKRSRSPEGVPGTFEAYLGLFDRIMERGLEEARQLKDLLSILSGEGGTMRIGKDGNAVGETGERNVFALKNRYMDFLDRLYDVESSPEKVEGVAWYDPTEEEEIARRARFLRHVPELTECRSRACDIYGERDAENLPVIKKHLSLLFGLNMDESLSVGNVLPGHNLILMGDREEGKRMRERMNSMLVDERMLTSKHTENIPLKEQAMTEDEKLAAYNQMRHELMIFNTNLLSGGLFRGGISIHNYRLVTAGESEYLLVFRNEEEENWLNIGRSNRKERLAELANLLRRYLLELNRRCEAVYVLEHSLFVHSEKYPGLTEEPFNVSFVVPDWTSRFHSERFMKSLDRIICRLLPAHIRYDIHRLNVQQMQYFEAAYCDWRTALAEHAPEAELRQCQDAMVSELTGRTERI